LVDWAGGGTRFLFDGSTVRAGVFFAYRFDRAAVSCNGEYVVVYEALGTKGLIVRGNKEVREINRSYYHAHVYEYPIALLDLPDGRTAIAHCPEAYNRLEIEEIESGRRLTSRPGESPDFFHSRLQVSPDGAYLLSAGWVWHPVDVVEIFPVREALNAPELLDQPLGIELPEEMFEVKGAAFQGNDSVLLVGNGDLENSPYVIGRYSITQSKIDVKSALETAPGTIMPVGRDHFVGFYEHPKLFEISSGKVILSWPELETGKQNSSILHHLGKIPPIALDPQRNRFAVAGPKGISVIQLG
jgi:hypothetical protein